MCASRSGERVARTRLALAVATAAAVVLTGPLIGGVRSWMRRTFSGEYQLLINIGLALVVAVGIAAALRRIRHVRIPRYAALAAAIAVAATFAWLTRSGNPDVDAVERFHFVEFGAITWLFYRAGVHRGDLATLLLPVLATFMAGVADEAFQWYVPGRVGEWRDVGINLAAIASGLLFSVAVEPPAGLHWRVLRPSRRPLGLTVAATALVVAGFLHLVHAGFDVRDVEVGNFTSRYDDATLLALARDRHERWRTDPPPMALARYSREDQYRSEGVLRIRRRNACWATDLRTAWRENVILEKFYGPVLDTPGWDTPEASRWPPAQRSDLAGRIVRPAPHGACDPDVPEPWLFLWPPKWLWIVAGIIAALGVLFAIYPTSVPRQPVTVSLLMAVTMAPLLIAQQTAPASPVTATGGQTSGTGAISGVISDAITGRPLAGAVVALEIIGRGPVGRAPRMVTDPRGRFLFRDLPASNDYLLTASRFGYADGGYGRATVDGSRVRIRLADDQWLADANVKLWRLGSISGQIIDEANEPIVGVAVTVYVTKMISGQPYQVVGPVVSTDDRGRYRIPELAPGRYLVCVLSSQSTILAATPDGVPQRAVGELASGGWSANGRLGGAAGAPTIDAGDRHRIAVTHFGVPPAAEAGRPRAYPPTFYPGATAFANAAPIEIGFNEDRHGIDIQMRPAPAARVAGRVIGHTDTVTNMPLRMMPVGAERLGFGSEVATTLVEPDGTFTFLNVPDGTYTIVGQPTVTEFRVDDSSTRRVPEPPGAMSSQIVVGSVEAAPGLGFLTTRMQHGGGLWARTPVSVNGRDLTDVVVRLNPGLKIRGNVAFEDGTKRASEKEHLWIQAEPANGDPQMGLHVTFNADGDKTFAFSFDGLMPGRYLLGRNLGRYRVTSIAWQGRDVTHAGLDTSSGDIDGVVMTVTDKLINVTGTVQNAAGGPGTPGAVIVFPTDRNRWSNYGWSPTDLWSQPIGATGNFRLQYLPAGEYIAVAVGPTQAKAWTDPKFLQAAAAVACRFSVTWGDEKTLSLQMTEVVVK
jgi:hypothetical protein